MKTGYDWIFIIFLGIAAAYDMKTRKIPVWLFWLSAIAACGMMVWSRDRDFWDVACGLAVGLGVLGLSKLFHGAIGEGDGIFFCISGILLGFQKNLCLLGGGIIVCGIYSACLILFGVFTKISVRTWKLPFLAFLVPVGVGVVVM